MKARSVTSCNLFLRKMASPALLNEQDAPVIRLPCLKIARNKMLFKILTQNARNTNAGPIFWRNRLILTLNSISCIAEQTDCPSYSLILSKKAREKDAVNILDQNYPEHNCRAHCREPICATLTGHNSC